MHHHVDSHVAQADQYKRSVGHKTYCLQATTVVDGHEKNQELANKVTNKHAPVAEEQLTDQMSSVVWALLSPVALNEGDG